MSSISYLTPTKNHWACDIEADDLLPNVTKIWCVTLLNCVTKEEAFFLDAATLKTWLETHPEAIFVGHNFLSYDAVVLNRLWNTRISVSRIVDTFLLSMLYNPSLPRPQGLKGKKGPHSLEAWGLRLGYPKGEFDDFSEYSEEMLKYCRRDTRLAALLFRKLSERMRTTGFTEAGVELEHQAWNIIQNKQCRNGFPFDYEKAQGLYVHLRQREEELKDAVYRLFPPRLEVVGEYKRPFKKDGTRSSLYDRHLGQFPKVVLTGETYQCYDYVSFDLGSPQQRIAKLLELGWKPVKFTKKTKKGGGGNPQVDEDSLLAFAEDSGNTELISLAKWVVVNSRANAIRTWMDAYNPDTLAIHGSLFLASTLRYRHSNPNTANIPSVRVNKDGPLKGEAGTWTYESRDLWTCGDPEEWSLVGIDAKGVQLRILAHYLNLPAFTEAILSDDPHTANMKTFGLSSRSLTKTITYATLMGAGDARIASEAKVSMEEAKAGKAAFFRAVPTLPALIERLQKELDRTGRITLCSGTPILVSSPHMVIPYLLQGDESQLMKRSLTYMDQAIRAERWQKSVLKVCDVHDEHQWRVKVGLEKPFIKKALPCFLQAGESFEYNIPIEGDAKIGKTWSETH